MAILLPCLLVPTSLACIIFARFKFRSSRQARSVPVDPGHEARMSRFAQHQAEAAEKEGWGIGAVLNSSWYGVTPVAGVGPNGTRTFLNGWFGLDGGRPSGWSAHSDAESSRPGPPSYSSTPRESNFSRASRASRRSQLSSRNTGRSEAGQVDELGRIEKEVRTEETLDDGDSFIEAGSRASESLMMREREPEREQHVGEKTSILRGD